MHRTVLAITLLLPVLAAADPAQLERLTKLMLEQEQKLQRIDADVRSLRGDMEVLGHKIDQAERGDRNLYADLDERLRKLETSMRATPVLANPSVTPVLTQPTASAPVMPEQPAVADTAPKPLPIMPPAAKPSTGNEQTDYQAAFSLLETGQYQPAISGFKSFLVQYPNGEYSDNAQYWLAESYYALRDYRSAQSAFQSLIETYPSSKKRAHAELKLGFVYYELKDKVRAKQILEQVRLHYPDTSTSRLAEERLRLLQIEGY